MACYAVAIPGEHAPSCSDATNNVRRYLKIWLPPVIIQLERAFYLRSNLRDHFSIETHGELRIPHDSRNPDFHSTVHTSAVETTTDLPGPPPKSDAAFFK